MNNFQRRPFLEQEHKRPRDALGWYICVTYIMFSWSFKYMQAFKGNFLFVFIILHEICKSLQNLQYIQQNANNNTNIKNYVKLKQVCQIIQ